MDGFKDENTEEAKLNGYLTYLIQNGCLER